MKKTIIVTAKVAGIHLWPDAVESVSFLADAHRHQFWLRAEFSVVGADREKEFFDMQSRLVKTVDAMWGPPGGPGVYVFGALSCEQIAEALCSALAADAVEVWEDGENGARVEREIGEGELLSAAWRLIANANGGDWGSAPTHWKEAAERWRDDYHRLIEKGGGS